MEQVFEHCIEMTARHKPSLFEIAPGYTLEQLQSITPEESKQLNKLESILTQHQTLQKHTELNQFARYCQTASDRILFRMMSHSSPLKRFLSQPAYNALWENRLERQGLSDLINPSISAFSQWENAFLKSHYEPWQSSPHASHSTVNSLKVRMDETQAVIDSLQQATVCVC